MKLQKFNGGLNTRQAPHLLTIDEGVEYTNIENEAGILRPCRALATSDIARLENDRYVAYLDDFLRLAKSPTSLVEYQNKTYYSVAGGNIQVKDTKSEGDLGLVPPVIEDASLNTTTFSPLITSDVTFSDIANPQTNIFGVIGEFKPSTTYKFAILKDNGRGGLSPPLYKSHTTNASGNLSNFIGISVNTAFVVAVDIGGVWRDVNNLHVGVPVKYVDVTTGVITGSPTINTIEARLIIGKIPNQIYRLSRRDILQVYRAVFPGLQGAYYGMSLDGYSNVTWGRTIDLTVFDQLVIFEAGTFSYVATLTDPLSGTESAPSSLRRITTTTVSNPVLTINLHSADARATRLTIYRIGGSPSNSSVTTEFTELHVVNNPTYPYIFEDRVFTANLTGGRILSSEKHIKPVPTLQNLGVVNGQLLGTLGSKLYFSEIGKFYAMPEVNFRDFKDTLTGHFAIDSGLLVFSAAKTWLLNTSNLGTGKILQLSNEFGCVGHNTIVGYRTGAMWTDSKGFCTSVGGRVQIVSKAKLGYVDLAIAFAEMYQETYFAFSVTGVTYAFDMRYSTNIKKYIFRNFNIGLDNKVIKQTYLAGSDLRVLFGATNLNRVHSVFKSSELENLTWKSAKLVEGAHTELKTYADIYLRSLGRLTFSVYIDDVKVYTKELYTEGTYNLKPPVSCLQGYGIQFEASGTGTIFEIEYKAEGRNNGR